MKIDRRAYEDQTYFYSRGGDYGKRDCPGFCPGRLRGDHDGFIYEVCPPHAVLASNTSALPIAAMASATKRPDKVLGLHFMNPVPVMRGVEIIRAMTTSDETMAIGREYLERLGKEVVEAVDYAGFIVSRVLDAMLNEAVKCVMDGNRPEEVDKAMKVCANFPMGPLELIDLAGVDIVLHGLETMEKDFGDRCHPAPLLRQMVRAGHLGRKSGKGFYDYT